MLLAEVAPMSSTHRVSSVLKIRDSSAMALERRLGRSWVFAPAVAGVPRKSFIISEVGAEIQVRPAGVTKTRIRKKFPVFVAQYNSPRAPGARSLILPGWPRGREEVKRRWRS